MCYGKATLQSETCNTTVQWLGNAAGLDMHTNAPSSTEWGGIWHLSTHVCMRMHLGVLCMLRNVQRTGGLTETMCGN